MGLNQEPPLILKRRAYKEKRKQEDPDEPISIQRGFQKEMPTIWVQLKRHLLKEVPEEKSKQRERWTDRYTQGFKKEMKKQRQNLWKQAVNN